MSRHNQIIRKSLRFSFLDGIFASCMFGLTTNYITPYALALKARVFQVGILNALPNLIGSLVQLKSPDLTEKIGSRRKIINIFVLLHLLMGLPIIFIPYLFKGFAVPALIVFVTLFTTFNAFAGPAWLSLMSDYLPPKRRASYFGWRNKIFEIIITVSAFAAGFLLHLFKESVLKGFMTIFGLAFVCRLISWYFLRRMSEPPLKIKKEAYFSFWDFLKQIKKSNFARFVLFVASLNFSVNLAAPFFSVFMLRDLKFNYINYTIVVTAVAISSIYTIDRWGRNADRIGSLRVLQFTSLFIATLPLLWLFCHHPLYLVLVQIIAGFAWSGFNLCVINFIYDAVTPEKRTRCLAYYNVCVGVALCLGSLTGGFLLKRLPLLFGYKTLSLFLLSGILRLFVVGFFSRRIEEVRGVEKISAKNLFFSVLGLKPISGIE